MPAVSRSLATTFSFFGASPMTIRSLKLLSDNLDEPFFDLNPADHTNPPRTRICSAWETINCAVDDLEPNEQIMALLEVARRAEVRANNLMQKLRQEAQAKANSRIRPLPFEPREGA